MKIQLSNGYLVSDIVPSDKPAFVEHLKDKDIHDHTVRIPYPYTDKDADEWIELIQKENQRLGRSAKWAIRRPDGYLIGGIGYHDYEPGKTTSEMGYWLAKPYWGKGIVTLATLAITEYGFKELGLKKITAHTADFNDRSGRVLEKAGFQFDQIAMDHYNKNGIKINAKLFFKTIA